MDVDLNQLTLAALLTTAGATVVATMVSGLVEILKRIVRNINGNEAVVVAVLSAVVVLLLAVQTVVSKTMEVGIPLILAVIFGWYGVTRLAMSVYDDVMAKDASLRSQL